MENSNKIIEDIDSIIRQFPKLKNQYTEFEALGSYIDFSSLINERIVSRFWDYLPQHILVNIDWRTITIDNLKELIIDNPKIKEIEIKPKDQREEIKTGRYNIENNIGIDIEHIKNFPANILSEENKNFRQRIYNSNEIAFSLCKVDPARTLRGIFCAKEAVIKASNPYIVKFLDVSIRYNRLKAPNALVRSLPNYIFKISISHTIDYSCAIAMVAKYD